GGKQHLYNFHGFPDDEFKANVRPSELSAPERKILSGYVAEGAQWGGDIDSPDLQSTWRLDRTSKEFQVPAYPGKTFYAFRPQGKRKTQFAEETIMDEAYDPNSPRKFLRVHVLGQQGGRMLTGELRIAPYGTDRNDGEYFRTVHVVRPATGGEASSLV